MLAHLQPQAGERVHQRIQVGAAFELPHSAEPQCHWQHRAERPFSQCDFEGNGIGFCPGFRQVHLRAREYEVAQ